MNPKIIDYEIIIPTDRYGNVNVGYVTRMLEEGWQPLGGLCACNSSIGNNSLYQVMVKYENVAVQKAEIKTEESTILDDQDYFYNIYSVRTRKCLRMSEIHTVRELLNFSANELMKIPNFGKKSLREIKDELEQLGLELPRLTIKEIMWK